jgi:hypothetical protein
MNPAVTSGATAAAAAHAATVQAIKASGVVVQLAPADFLAVLARQQAPLVVHAEGGFFSAAHTYLTSHKGLAFACKSNVALDLPADAERVEAAKIWLPG